MSLFGEEFRGEAVENLVAWGLKRGPIPILSASPISATTPTRAAPPIWACFPTFCPATCRSLRRELSREYPNLPAAPGKTLPQMLEAAAQGDLDALLVVGADPVSRAKLDPAALKNTFVVVQDLFLTETAALADVVLPAASLYEKSGTVTNTYGDIQMVRKAADRAGVKPDFEILVRLAEAWVLTSRLWFLSAKAKLCPAPPPISASHAARKPARPTVTPSGSKPTASNPN